MPRISRYLISVILLMTISVGHAQADQLHNEKGTLIYAGGRYQVVFSKGALNRVRMTVDLENFHTGAVEFIRRWLLHKQVSITANEKVPGVLTFGLNDFIRPDAPPGYALQIYPDSVKAHVIFKGPNPVAPGSGQGPRALGEYPMIYVPIDEANLIQIGLEGPLVDRNWVQRFSKTFDGSDDNGFIVIGQFLSARDLALSYIQKVKPIDEVQGGQQIPSAGALAYGAVHWNKPTRLFHLNLLPGVVMPIAPQVPGDFLDRFAAGEPVLIHASFRDGVLVRTYERQDVRSPYATKCETLFKYSKLRMP